MADDRMRPSTRQVIQKWFILVFVSLLVACKLEVPAALQHWGQRRVSHVLGGVSMQGARQTGAHTLESIWSPTSSASLLKTSGLRLPTIPRTLSTARLRSSMLAWLLAAGCASFELAQGGELQCFDALRWGHQSKLEYAVSHGMTADAAVTQLHQLRP